MKLIKSLDDINLWSVANTRDPKDRKKNLTYRPKITGKP